MVIDRFNGDDESYILYYLEVHKRVSNRELCEALHLSTSTIRKKLAKMEEKGLLIRTHGGAASIDANRDETMKKKSRINILNKKAIAAEACRFIDDGDVLALGGGSTVAEMAPWLLKLSGAVILTDSTVMSTLTIPNQNLEVHINSGIVRGRTGCVVGPTSDILFQSYSADKAFIGCDAFDIEHGAGSDNILVGKVEKVMLECAREKYILCDSTKLNQNSLYSFISTPKITALITDDDANPEYVKQMQDSGLKVILAPISNLSESEIRLHENNILPKSETLKKEK
ncbi:MAG: DeoR/GlpR family DNA-binding transcription regulator [Eubacterium sp.]|nr:DeoR/GlpR family DNA-binding transcription regulator [Eubacterium sp.]